MSKNDLSEESLVTKSTGRFKASSTASRNPQSWNKERSAPLSILRSTSLSASVKKGYACYAVGLCNGRNDAAKFVNAVRCHETTSLIRLIHHENEENKRKFSLNCDDYDMICARWNLSKRKRE